MNLKKSAIIVSAFMAAATSLRAQLYFVGNCNKDALSYKCGEEMVFDIALFDGDKPKVGQQLEWIVESDDGTKMRTGKAISGEKPLRLTTKCDKPGFVRVRVFAVDENGKRVESKVAKDWGRKTTVDFQGGAGACVEKIQNSGEEPKDFDAFWKRQLDAQKKIPLECGRKFLPNYSKNGFDVWELTVSCLGKPAKAFLSIPKNAKDKSLPLVVQFHGYGVGRINPSNETGAIKLSVMRHSYELLREPEYYKAMQQGELKGFGLSAEKNRNPEDCYFKFMVMRDLRAIEYVKKNVGQWNGKDITVKGGSMGAFQSIFVSSLDKDITRCIIDVPWMTDLWASDCGTTRIPCQFKPRWTPSIRYFDSTYAIKRVKCPVAITAWLGDYTCPPAGIMVLYNSAKVPVTIDFGQNGTHSGSRSKPETSKHFSLKKNF